MSIIKVCTAVLCLIILPLFMLYLMSAQPVNAAEKPNVVILFIDDLGYGDIGPFGCEDIPTPHMDKLASQGVICTQSYITNPPCCPSRCSLIMGMYAQRFGKYGMSRGLPIPEDQPTLAEFMKTNGYVTGQIGKWDIGSKSQTPMTQGFMEVAMHAPAKEGKKYICVNEDGSDLWRTDYDGDKMVEFVERNRDKPFFLYFSPFAVHSPNKEAPERLKARTTATNNKRRSLGGGIVSVDDQVGKLLAVLKKHQLTDKTLIFITGDNGANGSENGTSGPYRGGKGKGTQQNGWTITPAIISYPGKLPSGTKFHGMMCTLDYYATIAAAAGLDIPQHCDGKNVIPFLKGEKKGDVHEYIYWLNSDPTDAPRRKLTAVRWQDWRLYRHKDSGNWQLFDLKKDPKEFSDVSSKFPEVVTQIKRQHERWASTLPPVITVKSLPKIKVKDKDDKLNKHGIPIGYAWVMNQ